MFDVGANHGYVTRCYRSLFAPARIHAFEPFPDTFKKLQEATESDGNVALNQLAVTEAAGEETFYVNNLDPTNSLFERPKSGKRYYAENATTKEEIQVRSISSKWISRAASCGRSEERWICSEKARFTWSMPRSCTSPTTRAVR